MTANTRVGADAEAHADLQSKGNVRVASWHVSIDDKAAFQSYIDSRKCWHAGDGRGPGNTTTIAYELCVNSDGNYTQMIANAAERIAMDVVEYEWTREDIHQHEEFSPWGKNCPRELRGTKADISWEDFLDMIFMRAGFNDAKPASKPRPKPEEHDKSDGKTGVDGWWGTDTTIEVQYALGTPVDGEVSRQSEWLLNSNPGLTGGWKDNGTANDGGSAMVHGLWAFLVHQGISKHTLGRDDGKFGPNHIKGLQTWLKSIGYYTGPIDGELWAESATIKGIQRLINDGKLK